MSANRPALSGAVLFYAVGAGDGFSAVPMLCDPFGWSFTDTLQRPLGLAEARVGQRGATLSDPPSIPPS